MPRPLPAGILGPCRAAPSWNGNGDKEAAMTTRIAGFLGKAAVVMSVAATLVTGGGADARETDADNFFVRYPGPLAGQTGIDPNDPYAPVDLGGSGIVVGDAGNARATGGEPTATADTENEWDVPPLPGLPGRPY